MSIRPWMPLYVADFQIDTLDLDMTEVGAYLSMLMLAWQRSDTALPNDHAWLRRALRMHGNAFNKIIPRLLDRFFEKGADGFWRNNRLTKEKEKANKLSGKAKENVEKRWAKTRENKDLADTDVILSQHNTTQHNKKEKIEDERANARSPKRGTRLPEEWWPSDSDLAFARQTLTPEQADIEAEKFRDYWHARAGPGGVKLNWSATWRNWIRNSHAKSSAEPESQWRRNLRRLREFGESANVEAAGGDFSRPTLRVLPGR